MYIHFIWGESRAIYVNLGDWKEVHLRVKFHWLRLKVLGTPHLHGKAFWESQVLSGDRKLYLSFCQELCEIPQVEDWG